MAYGEDDYSEYSVEDQQSILYGQIGFGEPSGDPELHNLFYTYYYDDNISLRDRMAIYDELVGRIDELYGIDFGDVWDWEDFRAWYDSV